MNCSDEASLSLDDLDAYAAGDPGPGFKDDAPPQAEACSSNAEFRDAVKVALAEKWFLAKPSVASREDVAPLIHAIRELRRLEADIAPSKVATRLRWAAVVISTRRSGLSVSAIRLLPSLVETINRKGFVGWTKLARFGQILGLSKSSVSRAFWELVEQDFIVATASHRTQLAWAGGEQAVAAVGARGISYTFGRCGYGTFQELLEAAKVATAATSTSEDDARESDPSCNQCNSEPSEVATAATSTGVREAGGTGPSCNQCNFEQSEVAKAATSKRSKLQRLAQQGEHREFNLESLKNGGSVDAPHFTSQAEGHKRHHPSGASGNSAHARDAQPSGDGCGMIISASRNEGVRNSEIEGVGSVSNSEVEKAPSVPLSTGKPLSAKNTPPRPPLPGSPGAR